MVIFMAYLRLNHPHGKILFYFHTLKFLNLCNLFPHYYYANPDYSLVTLKVLYCLFRNFVVFVLQVIYLIYSMHLKLHFL